MILKKIKYIFISFLIAFLVLPTFCFALGGDIYVWSNSATASISPSEEELNSSSQTER